MQKELRKSAVNLSREMERGSTDTAPFVKLYQENVESSKGADKSGMVCSSREEVVKYLKEFIKSDKKKPYFVSIEVPDKERPGVNLETLTVFGYKHVTTIQTPGLIVHLSGNSCELGLVSGVSLDMCRENGSEGFDEALMKEILTTKKLKTLTNQKYESLVTVFSALDTKHLNLVYPADYTSMRVSVDDLKILADDYKEQLDAAEHLMKLKEQAKELAGGKLPYRALTKVLKKISTRNFINMCKDYGREYNLENEEGFAHDLLIRERTAKNKLFSFINTWQETDPAISALFKKDVRDIGGDLCELTIQRRIHRLEKDLAEHGDKTTFEVTRTKTWLSNLERALEIISQRGIPDEHNKP